MSEISQHNIHSSRSERRQATVMFADISGFTSLSEKMDPEAITSLMDECFRILGKTIEDYEGTIDKFIGDCIMAVFGVPKAIEDAPKKAILAAMSMMESLNQFSQNKNLENPLGLHIGINTGEVISGEIGSESKRDFTVMGDTVNLASRLDRLGEHPNELLRSAVVIGRSFFYKVLAEVATDVDDIEEELDLLKGIQLIRQHIRVNEIEYLFKHALVQEAVYESILISRRKKLHLHVAEVIERLFSARLHEFYGMLAYHYGRADNIDKSEKYLLKSGEFALRSSASSEVLFYYQQAIELYRNQPSDEIDSKRMAFLEKGVGDAYFKKSRYAEVVTHYNKALEKIGFKLPKTAINASARMIGIILGVMKDLYLAKPKKRKEKIYPSVSSSSLNCFTTEVGSSHTYL